MPQLSSQHDQLTAMVGFVRHEVVEEVDEVGREVLPGGARHRATSSRAELDQPDDAGAAAR
jgi:hypothetical protein